MAQTPSLPRIHHHTTDSITWETNALGWQHPQLPLDTSAIATESVTPAPSRDAPCSTLVVSPAAAALRPNLTGGLLAQVPNVAVHGWETSPLAKLLLHPALSTSVSSDDPSVMTCSLTSELELVEEGLGLGRSRAGEIALAAIDAAFCTDS